MTDDRAGRWWEQYSPDLQRTPEPHDDALDRVQLLPWRTLSGRELLVICHVYRDGLTVAEAARCLSISRQTAQEYHNSAISKLKCAQP